MTNKKFLAKEWLLIIFSLVFGHLFIAIFVVITDQRYNFVSFYTEVAEQPMILVTTGGIIYAIIQLVRSIIWSIRVIAKKY